MLELAAAANVLFGAGYGEMSWRWTWDREFSDQSTDLSVVSDSGVFPYLSLALESVPALTSSRAPSESE
jgi:hypothetical protein